MEATTEGSEAVVEEERADWLIAMDHASTIIMTCNTITLMMGIGAATYWREVLYHMKKPWGCLIGLICQFALLPAVGFGLSVGLQLPPYQALGVLILTCSPGGAFSNFFTFWVDGDLALSIIMTAASSVLSFGAMPLNLWLYTQPWTSQEMSVPYLNVLVSLAFVTAPAIMGMVLRHYNRKWANYVSKVCGLLGWAGAMTCGVMLILMYWHVIVNISVYLMVAAAVVPVAGFVVAYIMSKAICFSHRVCRTVAIETACQNMVVATNVILLSFPQPQIRGQMVIFPVVYGLFQLAQMLVGIAGFQVWLWRHRDDVTEEVVGTVVDNTVLTSVPVPAHKLSEAQIQSMTGSLTPPDICQPQLQYNHQVSRYHESPYTQAEVQPFLSPDTSSQDGVWSSPMHVFSPRPELNPSSPPPDNGGQSSISNPKGNLGPHSHPLSPKGNVGQHLQPSSPSGNFEIHSSPPPLPPSDIRSRPNPQPLPPPGDRWSSPNRSPYDIPYTQPAPRSPIESPTSPYVFKFPEVTSLDGYQRFLDDDVFSDGDFPSSPTLSNKGVPNMFPVTPEDYLPRHYIQDEEGDDESPPPYGSPVPTLQRYRIREDSVTRWQDPTCSEQHPSPSSSPPISPPPTPTTPSTYPTSPTIPSSARLPKTFGFYHDGVRIGQTQQFSTFGRRK